MKRTLGAVLAIASLVAACGTGATSPSSTLAPPVPSAAASAPGASPTPAPSLGTVRVALDWTPNTNHTGFYMAEGSGLESGMRRLILLEKESEKWVIKDQFVCGAT